MSNHAIFLTEVYNELSFICMSTSVFLEIPQAYQSPLPYIVFEQNHDEAIFLLLFLPFYPLLEQTKITAQFLFALYVFKLQHILNTLFLLKYISGVYVTGKMKFMNLIYR